MLVMSVIDDFLQDIPSPERAELERIRRIVKTTVPDAEETISYAMPAFKYKDKPLVYFNAFKDHMSLFPTSEPTEVLHDKLKDYKVSKGTIQFTLDNPLPEPLIKEILEVRLGQIK
jgi:uncharacterized protein YdhG (YjbR/CyaY superfamily)